MRQPRFIGSTQVSALGLGGASWSFADYGPWVEATPISSLRAKRHASCALRGRGGSVIFIGSKNALAPGRNAAAYSAAKAASLHLARCLAEELGSSGIRDDTVNPDAVLEGSRIWGSAWREERARAYGIPADALRSITASGRRSR